MKYRKWMTLGAALAFLFTAQPAYAAPVILAGSGSSAAENTQNVGEQPGIGSCDSGTGSRSDRNYSCGTAVSDYCFWSGPERAGQYWQ